jgi:catechol 2,3-dioxygenase-like lactoylglutathione lyase family enzyme
MPPPLRHITETAVYVDDLDAAADFYGRVLGLKQLGRQEERHVFFQAGPEQVLLCFIAATTLKGETLAAHGSTGPGHFALGIDRNDFAAWREHLEKCGIEIELEQTWDRGGRSLYFRDPAGNSVELATPGIWGLPSGW